MLSGNRNFEGRINPDVKMNYLASPPLVIAYALAGTMDFDVETEPLGTGHGRHAGVPARHLAVAAGGRGASSPSAISQDMFTTDYADVFAGDERWQSLPDADRRHLRLGRRVDLRAQAAVLRRHAGRAGRRSTDVEGARVLALLGDSRDDRPHQPRRLDQAATARPAATSTEHGVERKDFNSYGSRRGNHEVMIRGTFANIRLRNLLLDGVEGGFTRNFLAGGEQTTIYDAAQALRGRRASRWSSSRARSTARARRRDWAAKGTALLGVRAVIAESYERIHRSNLIGMGVLPLQFPAGESAASLGLDGTETFDDQRCHRAQRGPDAAHRRRPGREGGRQRGDVRRRRPHRHSR